MDELERKVLQAIDEAVAASPPTMPFVLSQEHQRLIRLAEEHPANRPGADKTWVERVLVEWEQLVASARKLPPG